MRILFYDFGREYSPIDEEIWLAVTDIFTKHGKQALHIVGDKNPGEPSILSALEKYQNLE